MYEGYKWRAKHSMQELAQLASWVTAPHVKKPIDPRKLLEDPKEKKKTTPQETKQLISKLEQMMGVS